jgi:hypothetical protein
MLRTESVIVLLILFFGCSTTSDRKEDSGEEIKLEMAQDHFNDRDGIVPNLKLKIINNSKFEYYFGEIGNKFPGLVYLEKKHVNQNINEKFILQHKNVFNLRSHILGDKMNIVKLSPNSKIEYYIDLDKEFVESYGFKESNLWRERVRNWSFIVIYCRMSLIKSRESRSFKSNELYWEKGD